MKTLKVLILKREVDLEDSGDIDPIARSFWQRAYRI